MRIHHALFSLTLSLTMAGQLATQARAAATDGTDIRPLGLRAGMSMEEIRKISPDLKPYGRIKGIYLTQTVPDPYKNAVGYGLMIFPSTGLCSANVYVVKGKEAETLNLLNQKYGVSRKAKGLVWWKVSDAKGNKRLELSAGVPVNAKRMEVRYYFENIEQCNQEIKQQMHQYKSANPL